MSVMARTAGDPSRWASPLRSAVYAIDPDQAVYNLRSFDAVIARAVAARRFQVFVLSLFAIIALTLGLVGVAGVLSFDVAQRRREIGIRLALGATRGDVSKAVFRRGLILTACGVAAGIGGAVHTATVLKSMLVGISATHPATIAGVAVAFVAVMLVAMYVPARRAANVDPLETMKDS
jgi:ABC-type antimicrobial peptide transport system permease subunit